MTLLKLKVHVKIIVIDERISKLKLFSTNMKIPFKK